MNGALDNTNFDAFIFLYPDYPYLADSGYRGSLNPSVYFARWNIPVQEGELLKRVHVRNLEGSFWEDKVISQINDFFPNYLPLRLLINGKEDEILEVIVKGQRFRFKCRQHMEKFGKGSRFEDVLTQCLSKIAVRGDRNAEEFFVRHQPFNIRHYPKALLLEEGNRTIGHISSETIVKLFRHTNQRVPKTPHRNLKRFYSKVRTLGGGGEGAVFAVKNPHQRAFKITKTYPYNNATLAVVNHLLDTGSTPHLTKTFRTVKIPCHTSFYDLFDHPKENDFFTEEEESKGRVILSFRSGNGIAGWRS